MDGSARLWGVAAEWKHALMSDAWLRGAGRLWRRRIILAEFVLGALGGTGLGLWQALSGTGAWQIFGGFLAGIGLNYVPLTLHAVALSRRGALEEELAGVDIVAELRHYTAAQFWVLVPLCLVVLSVRQASRSKS